MWVIWGLSYRCFKLRQQWGLWATYCFEILCSSCLLKDWDRAWWYNSTSAVRGACFPPISVWTQPGWTARAPIYTNIVNFLLSSCLEDLQGPILLLRPVVERGQGSKTWWPHWVRLWRSGKGRGLPMELECSHSKHVVHNLFGVLSYTSENRWQVDHQAVLLKITLILTLTFS